ncbi:DUF7916 family protein [Oceanivirga salmonicida]|uniref:DUF7916 family protein n=1 Tax=Oceanivirga salmonicida TaxID=1769291 RepID=UPI00082D0D12|nr:PEP phosphonomutase [Oceanivirga salmonicida]
MMKRFLNLESSEMINLSKDELFQSIKASEGRIIVSENVVVSQPLVSSITNCEVARAFGADLILLNIFDLFNPEIAGLKKCDNPIIELKKLVGRPIGVNLEPIDLEAQMLEERAILNKGRQVSLESVKRAQELGFDFICLTGNPGTGVTTDTIAKAITLVKENFSGLILAGKMHGAGTSEDIYDKKSIIQFIEAGADVIMIPSPGTVPGSSIEKCTNIVEFIKSKGKLTLGAIGTSQESSNIETIRQIGLYNKMIGFDMHHIGDAGYCGLADFENIMELSIAVRGKRHTLKMMCSSINR